MTHPDNRNYDRVWRALCEARSFLVEPGGAHHRLTLAWERCSEIPSVLVPTGCLAPSWLITEVEQLQQRWDQLDLAHSRIEVFVSTLSDHECTEAAEQILGWCDRLRDDMRELAD